MQGQSPSWLIVDRSALEYSGRRNYCACLCKSVTEYTTRTTIEGITRPFDKCARRSTRGIFDASAWLYAAPRAVLLVVCDQ